MESEDTARRSITRRNVLKGGAVIGGVIWAAPVVETLMASPAGAATTAASEVHFCCFCYTTLDTPTNCGTTSSTLPNATNADQVTADGSPATADACACYCAQQGFTTYQWGGASAAPYGTGLGRPGHSSNPNGMCGCFLNGSAVPVATGGPGPADIAKCAPIA